MKIIAGLGNPGFRYRNTRHNAGFRVIDELAKKYRIRVKKKGFHGVYGVGVIAGEEVMLFKPLTFMNLSGEAIEAAISRHLASEASKEDLLVIADDLSLPLGSFRIRKKGSSGGHNGLESIIGRLGEDFTRLKVGIGSENMPEDKASYVLAPFSRKDAAFLGGVISDVLDALETWVSKGALEAISESSRKAAGGD